MQSELPFPETDPTPLFELFRGSYATELLTAAVSHLGVFDCLRDGPLNCTELRTALQLEERPFVVLITALRAMQLLELDSQERLILSRLAREHLLAGAAFDITGYIGLAAGSPGVLEMVERMRSNRPAGSESQADEQAACDDDAGVAFIYREGEKSAMESEASARHLTLSLAGRAKNVAPHLAACAPLEGHRLLVDVGGGSGIYSIACLLRNPSLRAIVWDRPEVLKVAEEMAAGCEVGERLVCLAGDMFVDPIPADADAILLSNILHDWDVPGCRALIARCADALPTGGKLLIHDVYLNDALDGPLPLALYSAALFTLTEGRAYSAAEYRGWLTDAGLVSGDVVPTLVHCGLLVAVKP